jgi:hypothetical protein
VAEEGALVPEELDEEELEDDELLDEEVSPLDSFVAADAVADPPEDEPALLSVR